MACTRFVNQFWCTLIVLPLLVGGCSPSSETAEQLERSETGDAGGSANGGGAGAGLDAGFDAGNAEGSELTRRTRPRPTPERLADSAPEFDPSIEWIVEDRVRVDVGGEEFLLEIADTNGSRYRGLSFRESVDERGGMVFVFSDKAVRSFVMRDCRVPIDIAYTTDSGRIVQSHAMQVEPRIPGESDQQYEFRLTRYSSKFPTGFVFEFAGGTLEALGVDEGDYIVTDFGALKARAK